jgi:hypothetical protein
MKISYVGCGGVSVVDRPNLTMGTKSISNQTKIREPVTAIHQNPQEAVNFRKPKPKLKLKLKLKLRPNKMEFKFKCAFKFKWKSKPLKNLQPQHD